MTTTTVYIDASGTDDHSKIVATAFCVGQVKKWKRYERAWEAIENEEGFKHFHMTEFAGCRKEKWCRDCSQGKKTATDHPWREWSQTKRKRVVQSLADVIGKYIDCGYGIATTKQDYDRYVLNSPSRALIKEPVGELYVTHSLQLCGGELAKWRANAGLIGEPLDFVFDTADHVKERAEVADVFFATAHDRPQVHEGIEQWFTSANGITFESRKTLVQLLSADMLAYVAAKIRAAQLGKCTLGKDAYLAIDRFLASKKIGIGHISEEEMRRAEAKRLASMKPPQN